MILSVPPARAEAILGAMNAIAAAGGETTPMDALTVSSAAEIVFGLPPGAGGGAAPRDPAALAAALATEEEARQACRFIAVMALVDGRVDTRKLALVAEYASALDIHEDYVRVLAEVAEDEIAQAAACINRKNVDSFPYLDHTLDVSVDPVAPFLPYRDAPDPDLEARYAALGQMREGTFGRAFFDHFQRNHFMFPGHPNGLAEGFTTPHDSSHVLSGYSTTTAGEICVSTFISAMHPDHPMAAEVLPVIMSWHMGIRLTDAAGATTGSFHPPLFWTAWDRGAATSVDVVDAAWDFWAATEAELEDLRREYTIPPLPPELAA